MKVYIIGTGVGDIKILSVGTREKIEKSDVLIGAKRVLEPFSGMGKQTFISHGSDEIAEIIRNSGADTVSVLMSGDAGFYSGAKKLLPLLGDCCSEVIPGISSLAYFCAKLGISYENLNLVSLHGRECNIAIEVRSHYRTFALLGENPCKRLCEFGLGDTKVYVGERLSYADEKITVGKVSELALKKFDPLSVMIIENQNYDDRVRIGIDDGEFIRGDVPMTKSEVRSVSVSKLCIGKSDICWDIGAGTGSVTVEAALLCVKGTVYAVEKNREAAELICANCRKFAADNVKVVEGIAPECLDGLEAPDKVFIGGASGNMRGIIKAALVKNKDTVFVINAIALETAAETISVLKELNMDFQITQINAARGKNTGTLNLMLAQNPVYIITAKGAE